jgi:transcriptional regulator with XRE-family HTH domain
MDIKSTVGTNIRKLRQAKGISQETLAFEAGIDRSYLSEVESGRKNVGIEVLEKVAKALGVSPKVLF